jgi:WD40 repeat protein
MRCNRFFRGDDVQGSKLMITMFMNSSIIRRRWLRLAAMGCVLTCTGGSAAEPSSTPMLRIEPGMHAAQIKSISADAAGRLALTCSDDKTARIWELPSGRLLRVLRPPLGEGNEGKLSASALRSDGALAAVGGFTGKAGSEDFSVYLFDTATGTMVGRFSGLPNVILNLAFSAKGRFLAAVGGGWGLQVWETATGRVVGRDTDYGKPGISYGVDWHGDRLVTAGLDGQLRLYRLAAGDGGGKLTLLKKGAVKGGESPVSTRFSPDGRRIAVGFGDSTAVMVADGHDLSFLFAPDTAGLSRGTLGSVAWTDDGLTLVAGGAWLRSNTEFPIRHWPEGGRGKPRDTMTAQDSITDLRPLPGGGLLFGAGDPAWGMAGQNGPPRLLGVSPIGDFPASGVGFGVSADGTAICFGYDRFGKNLARFSVGDRQLESLKTGEVPASLRAPRLVGLKITDWMHTRTPKLAGKPLTLGPNEESHSLAITADASSFLLGASFSLRSYTAKGEARWELPVPGRAIAVNLANNDRLAVVTYHDGTIRWHRYDNGQELLALFPHADRRRWVLWTPQGYYDCSPGAEELIGWHVNRGKNDAAEFFPAAKFREQFYRPDVIQLVLSKGDVAEALKTANDAAGRKAQPVANIEAVVAKMQPPVVELTVGGARGEATAPAGKSKFTVRYRVRRGGPEPVTRMRVLVDGRPADLVAPVPASDTAEASAEVPLPPRDCIVAVLAENRFAVSEPATLRLLRTATAPEPEPATLRPKLYLLAAGITDYVHNEQLDDLHFAAKDAGDFVAAFRRQEGGLYEKVDARLLTDAGATAAAIKDGLDWIRQETTAKDVAVIFLSGHGENDEELRYFFCAQDYDKKRRSSTGVSFEEIQRSVRAIPGKVLFFIDSCHAGNALGKLFAAKSAGAQLDVTRLVNELSGAENGAVVFTSSTGRQLSLELAKEGNGAFTKAIVEGLNGKADLRNNGRITVSSLEFFLAERVKELTDGQQTPTVAKPQTVPDFPIAVKR